MSNKNILLSAVLAVLSVCVAAPYKFNSNLPVFEKAALSNLPSYLVVEIINGDTIVVDVNNQITKIRLIGVNMPEIQQPDRPAGKYNSQAASFTDNLLRGENVYIIDDPNQNGPDKFSRVLKYIYRAPDGLFVNAELLRQGYGRADTTLAFKYMTQFKQLEEFAKERKKGIWNIRQSEIEQPNVGKSETISPPTLAVPPPQDNSIVYITKTGKKYHRSGCSFLSKSSTPIKLDDAKARGYTPCGRCNPP
jgi:micrococcal nuclease